MRRLLAATAIGALLGSGLLASCSEGTPGATATPASPGPQSSPAPSTSCPPRATTFPAQWPPEIPPDLPKPPGAVIEKVERTANNVTVVRFSTPLSLREGVLLVVRQFPAKGYQIGRGDAEVTEADAPFQRGTLRGLVRLITVEQCKTLWLLAVGSGGGAPFAPNYSPPASASPLPFG